MAKKTEYQDIEVKGSVVADKVVNPNEPANYLLRSDGEVQNPNELSVCEANLLWGGRNIVNSFSPVDAAMVSELSANLMAFPNPAGITVEYSRDAGVTWLDYEATDKQKIEVFTKNHNSYWCCGKPELDNSEKNVNFRLRVTLDTFVCGFYSYVNKVVANVSTNASTDCWLTILAKKKQYSDVDENYETIVNKATIAGWPGYNVINFSPFSTWSGSETSYWNQRDKIRFVLGYDSISEYTGKGLVLVSLSLYGNGRYAVPSQLALHDHLYSFDYLQNALFPAKVESKEVINFDVNNIEPTQTGNVSKTSTWLWQYLVQGVNWLKKNYLPASTLDTKTISDFSELSASQVNYFVDSTLTDSVFNQKVTFPTDWKGRKIFLNLAPVTFQKGWDYSLKVLFADYMKATGARLFIENDLSAMVGVSTLIKIIIDNNVIIVEAYIEA